MKRVLFIFAILLAAASPDADGQVLVRTNLLLPLTNFGVEVPVAEHIVIESDIYFPWVFRKVMDSGLPDRKYCFQLLNTSVGCRYRFPGHEDPLDGHSICGMLLGGIYDFGRNWHGRQGRFWAIGFDYMYTLRIRDGLYMEFDAGIGYSFEIFRKYSVPAEGGKLIGDGPWRYRYVPIPVKVGVSIAIPSKGIKRKEAGKNDK